jgi:preprotein translocase subunit SecE
VVAKSNNSQSISKKQKKDKVQEVSFPEQVVTYFKGVRSEWHKVTWPDRQQILRETLVVIAVTIFVTVLIYLIDIILRFLLGFITVN